MKYPGKSWSRPKKIIAAAMLTIVVITIIFIAFITFRHKEVVEIILARFANAGPRKIVPSRPCWQVLELQEKDSIIAIPPFATISRVKGNHRYFLSPDSSKLVSTTEQSIGMLNLQNGQEEWSIEVESKLRSVAFSPSGAYLGALCETAEGNSVEETLQVIDSATGRILSRPPNIGTGELRFIDDNIIMIWKKLSVEKPRFFRWREKEEFSPDELPFHSVVNPPPVVLVPWEGRKLGNYQDNVLKNIDTGKTYSLKCYEHCGRVVTPDGQKLISYKYSTSGTSKLKSGHFEIVDLNNLEKIKEYSLKGYGSYQVSPDATLVLHYNIRQDNFYHLVESTSGKTLRKGKLDIGPADYLAISPDNRFLIAPWKQRRRSDYGVKIIDIDNGEIIFELKKEKYGASCGSFLSDERVGFISFGEYVIYDYQTGREVKRLGKKFEVLWARPAPDGKIIGLCSEKGAEEELLCLKIPQYRWSFDAALSPDAKQVAVGRWASGHNSAFGLDVIDIASEKTTTVFEENQNTMTWSVLPYPLVIWGKNGKVYFINAATQTLGVWNPEDGSMIRDLSDCGHYNSNRSDRSGIEYIGLSQDGRVLVTANSSVYNLWDQGSMTNEICVPLPGRALGGSMALHPGGRYLALVKQNTVLLIDLTDQSIFARLDSIPGLNSSIYIRAMNFSEDGKQFLITFDENILVYRLPIP